MKADEAKPVLGAAVEWGRYGEVYEYEYGCDIGRLKFPDQEAEL